MITLLWHLAVWHRLTGHSYRLQQSMSAEMPSGRSGNPKEYDLDECTLLSVTLLTDTCLTQTGMLLADQWEGIRRKAETEEGHSKESRAHQAISHNVCNTTKLQPPQDMSAEGCSGRSGDMAFDYAHGSAHVDEVQASGSGHEKSDVDD